MIKKQKKQTIYVVNAHIKYGPFASKAVAESYHRKVGSVNDTVAYKITKSAKGYSFTARYRIDASSVTERSKHVSAIKRKLPNAKITFSKR